jgi:N-acetylglucosaminyl-diphospho-decaprenol L-rhamnosyltransferase
VTVTFGASPLVRRLVTSLSGHPDRRLLREIIVVDNGYPEAGDSRPGLADVAIEVPLRFVQNASRSYSSGINAGAAVATGELLALSNNDVAWLPDHGIAALVTALRDDPGAGVAGPQLVFPDGSWQRSYGSLPSLSEASRALLLYEIARNALLAARFRLGWVRSTPWRVPYIDGAFMLVRRSCFERLNGFDSSIDFYGEDVDFCWRALRAGYKSLFVPSGRLTHVRGASSTTVASLAYLERMHRARIRFVERRSGAPAARIYRRLLQISSWELVLLHTLAWCVRPTTQQKRRVAVSVSTARAAMGLANVDGVG